MLHAVCLCGCALRDVWLCCEACIMCTVCCMQCACVVVLCVMCGCAVKHALCVLYVVCSVPVWLCAA